MSMQNPSIKKNRAVFIFTFMSGCLGLIIVTVFDKLYWNTDILAEGYPDFTSGHVIRSIIIFASVAAILWSLIGEKKPELLLVDRYKYPKEIIWIWGTIAIDILFLALFVFTPEIFSISSVEDGPIEWGSALLSLSSCIILIFAFFKSLNHSRIPKTAKASLLCLSLIFFMITMEEISWGQKFFNFEATNIFDGNDQNETTIHNLATDAFENMYYMGTFLFFACISYISWLHPSLSDNKYLRLFVARPYIAIIATIPAAYNFDMWNVNFIQISFFGGVIILLSFVIFSKNRDEKYLVLFVLILNILAQGLFLMNGEETFCSLKEITEYKEFFIPLIFFIYSLDVSTYINRVYLPEKS